MTDGQESNWRTTTLGNLATLQYGRSPTLITKTEGEYDLIGTSGVLRRVGEFLCDTPSVVIGRKGTIDNPIYADRPFWATDTTYYTLFDKSLDPKWFYYQISAIDLTKYNEASGVPSLGRETLNSIALQVPPLDEQKKIAEILTTVDEVIENTEAEISKLEYLKKATMNEILTKGIGHTEFKETEIGRIPKSWKIVSMRDVCDINYGKAPNHKDENEGNYPIIGTGGVIGRSNEYLCKHESVVIGRKGTIDKPIHVDAPFWPIDTTYYVSCKKVDCRWLWYRLQFENLAKYNEASGVPSLSRETLYSIKLQLPSDREQKAQVNVLDQISVRLTELRDRLRRIRAVKIGVMQDLLTGKVRVKVN